MEQAPSNGTIFAVLSVERLADILSVQGRRSKPQLDYKWPQNIDRVVGEMTRVVGEQPTDVPLHVLGILPAWMLTMLAVQGEWTEVWVCHAEDGSPWLQVSAPGSNDSGLPTITGTTWAFGSDPLHLWTRSELSANRGLLVGTLLQRGRLMDPDEQYQMSTVVPVEQPTNGILFVSAFQDGMPLQVQAEIMAARVAYAYAQPGPNRVKVVAVECSPNCYVIVHSTDDAYSIGDVVRTVPAVRIAS